MKTRSATAGMPPIGLAWAMAVGLCSATVTNDPTGDLALPRAIALATAHEPELQASALDVQAAECRLKQATLLPNPVLSVEAEDFGGRNELKGFDGAKYSVLVEQTVELGGKRDKRIRAAECGRQLEAASLQTKRLDTRWETTRRFVAVQGAQVRLALQQESLVLAEEFSNATQARAQAGKTTPMDADKARILLAQEKTAAELAQGDLQVARVRLAAMWGSVAPRFAQARGDLQSFPDLPPLPSLLPRMERSPETARLAAETEQSKAVLVQEKAGRIPDLTIAGGVSYSAEAGNETLILGLSLPLPVFDRNQARIREASLLLDKAEMRRRAAQVAAAVALTEAYQALAAALNRIASLRNDVIPKARSVFTAVQTGYTEGKFGYIEVLDARRTFFEARVEYIEALVSGHNALVEVERLIGTALSENQDK